MTDPVRLLVVDPVDGVFAERIGRLDDAFVTVAVERLEDAMAALGGDHVHCVVCTDGFDRPDPVAVVGAIADGWPEIPVVVTARDGSERLATDVLGAGAIDYLPLSDEDRLAERIWDALENQSGEPSTVETAVTSEGTPVPLESVAGSLSEVLVTIDEDSTVQYVNDAVREVFGYDPAEVVGSSLTMLMPDRFHGPHHEGVARYLDTGDRALDWSSIELPGEHADGREIDLEISFGEFTVAGERHFTGLLRDVSPLVERETALSDLYEASDRLLLASTPEEIAEITAETASKALDLPITGVYRHEPGLEALVPVATTEQARALFGEPTLAAGESLAWETFENGETRVIRDVAEQGPVHDPETDIRTELQVPIGDRWLLVSGSREDRQFDDYQIDFAELLSTTAAAAFESAQREAELRRYETIFETIDARVAVLDASGHVRMANQALCSFLGRSEDGVLGSSAADFVSEADAKRIRTRLGSLESGESTTVEVTLTTADRSSVPCEVVFAPLPEAAQLNGVVAVVHDISERREVESELQHQRDRFVELFENVPDPVVEATITDGKPIVESVNDAFEETFGYDAERVVGNSLNEFVLPPEEGDAGVDLDRKAAAGELVSAEVRRETAGGIRYFLFRGIPVTSDDGEGTPAFGVYTDITDQRLRQRRLGVLNRVLRHNIRNDMSVVLGRANYLEETDEPDDLDTHAEAIRRMAEDVVDLAEGIRTAEQALDREDAPSRPLATIIDQTVEPYRQREDAVVRTTVGGSLPSIDERIGIVLEALIENAIEHGDREPTTVEIAVERPDHRIAIEVRDDGPGLPAEERTILERQEETPLEHGQGVGLWLVTWLVTSLGGDVEYADNEPRGSIVRLSFPDNAVSWPEA